VRLRVLTLGVGAAGILAAAAVLPGSAATSAAPGGGGLRLEVSRDTADDSGLYVRGQKAGTTPGGGPAGQFDRAVLASPYIRGGIIRLAWKHLEPSQGSQDWTLLDNIAGELKQRGLKYIVVVSAGSDSPPWLLTNPRVQTFHFERKKRGAVVSPLPWDEAYLEAWGRFLKALGGHIAADPDFVAIRAGGVQAGTSVEMALPKILAQHGYTSERVKRVWAATLEVYAEAFPGKRFVITIDKLIDTTGESGEQTARAIIDQAVGRYGRRLVLSNSGVNPKREGFSAQLISSYTSTDRALAQLGPWAPITGSSAKMSRGKGDPPEKRFRDVFDTALRMRARYFGIDQHDLLDPRLEEGLRWLAAKREAEEGQPLKFTVKAIPDQPGLRYAAASLPAGAAFDAATHAFVWTPRSGQAGVYRGARFEVSDGTRSTSLEVPIIVRRSAK